MGWVEALIGTIGLVAVALIQKDRSEGKKRREADSAEHSFLVDKVENLGKSLGISIDRVEGNLGEHIMRVETTLYTVSDKLDEHIHDHAVGNFDEIEKPRKKKVRS